MSTSPEPQTPPSSSAPKPWAASPEEVLASVDSTIDGLAGSEVERRLARDGRNELPTPKPVPAWRRLLSQYNDILIYILIAAAALKAYSGDWVDFAVIAVVILATGLIGFIQEGRAASALASLQTMQSLDAQVLRDGTWGVVDAATIVLGDVIRVRSGDRVPADVRLLTSSSLQVDEAALTGESVPAQKELEPVAAEAGVGDRSSMLFSSTIITAGTAEAVVVSTGGNTEIGRISALVADQEKLDTPLSRQLAKLGTQLAILIGVMAVVMLAIGYFVHDFHGDELISAAIGFAVAAVPEGLPALVTITLALGVQQMARRNAITRKMAAVETLGSVTTICSDKTGTLTQNEMTARTVLTSEGRYVVEGTGYQPKGHVTDPHGQPAALPDHPDLEALVIAAGAANDARVEETDEGWRVVGQPTEGALDVLATKAGADMAHVTRLATVPFESAHKFSATLDDVASGERRIHVLGAPDRLLDRSTTQLGGGGSTETLDHGFWDAGIDELSEQGLRVLAAASRPADGVEDLALDDLDTGLTFLGLVGIVDPPRPEVTDAISLAHTAGIRVKMITGDHAGTAVAISRELGIAPAEGDVKALTGAELEAMSDDELAAQVRDVDIYARTSPEHKLRIVKALQTHDEVVAMTGDGVNDAPSITRADVGVAMGIKGTEATKEAADIVLADDNFATIERAVEEGRRIYDNIRKSVVFLLPTNGGQGLVILVAVLLGMALPLSPVQILWVNLVTALTLSLSLSSEPAEPGIMSRPPRSTKEQILSPRALAQVLWSSVAIGGAALLMFMRQNAVVDYDVAQTAAVTMLAFGQIAFLFNCRFLNTSSLTWRVLVGNRAVWFSIAGLIALQLIFIHAPFMNTWFGSSELGWAQWGPILGLSVGVFLFNELGKFLINRVGRR